MNKRPRASWGAGRSLIVVVAVLAAVLGGLLGGGIVAATAGSGTASVREVIQPSNEVAQINDIPSILAKVEPGVVTITTNLGAGTGMVLTPGGEVLTNYHVVQGSSYVHVKFRGASSYDTASIKGFDQNSDVALLQVKHVSGLATVTLGNSAKLQVGNDVIAVGNALDLAGGPTVTSGIVSAIGRTLPGQANNGENIPPDLLQTDAAINPGNSGGPLVDANGHVVGMNTLIIQQANAQQSAQNLGFAIPVNSIKKLLPSLSKGAHVVPAYLGVQVGDNSAALAKQYGIATSSGAIVTQVMTGSPASRAGLHARDVIVAVSGHAVASASALVKVITGDKVGTTITLTVVRGHKALHLRATLVAKPSAVG